MNDLTNEINVLKFALEERVIKMTAEQMVDSAVAFIALTDALGILLLAQDQINQGHPATSLPEDPSQT